ncbi:hypothetical protein SAMN05443575_1840 [Jatrophihabitans endophyticus]|uniref:Uncharacterized protein n=1 Tax=Jatrophihabitans endophyticus TaxID=1206085 RepID=A0A1M5IBL0_9ACTN|nr:hypothetical protein [Jatrophihabitans endophyticus]SHG25788.1 hypothetical protein SAMN05443575_1840 [Jatrophihabitans endophyticus]
MTDHSVPWGGQAGGRIGHHASTLLSVAVVAVVAVGLFPPPGLLAVTVPVALFAFVIAMFLLMRQHDRSLCEHCMLSMPLDAAERAARVHRRFWVAHSGSEPRILLPYLAVLVGSNFATTPYGRALWAVVQLSLIYLLLASATHRRLQPWCPWCRGGGGGSDVDETPPVLPHDDRQLT